VSVTLGLVSQAVMSAAKACAVLRGLMQSGVRHWVMGGWGIDALQGKQTRTHHDLDLLVQADDLPVLQAWLRAEGFARNYEWEENSPVQITGTTWDTAFVEHHADGRELDVHAVWVESGGPRVASSDPWTLPANALEGRGRIGDCKVSCASPSGQRALHVGYDLPATHEADLAKLDGL
jgi:lincosamide nucleotidyltransferase A/C/D/E